MSVHIECKKGKSINVGYGNFFKLRLKVAELCSDEFGKHYSTLMEGLKLHNEERTNFYKNFDEKTKSLIEENKVNRKVVDFCLQSDCDGKVGYGCCKKIYEYIKEYEDDFVYGYCNYTDDEIKFKDFKDIVKECIDLKCDLVWY